MPRVHVREVTRGPLQPAEGPAGPRLARRVKGIAAEVGGLLVLTPLLPLVLLVAVVVDAVLWVVRRRKPFMAVRLALYAWWFLFGELRGLLGLLAIWALTGGPFGRGSLLRRRLVYGLRIHWARSHLGGVRVLFGLTFEVEGLEHATPGNAIVLIRHASIIDNTLADAVIGHAHGLGLRFVLKRELEMLPLIDIGGRWVPVAFVRRASDDAAGETARLRTLAHDLGPGEAVVIYPEGTRWTPAKLARAQEVVRERRPDVAPMADRLRYLLPPRLGGPIALLEDAPDADVVLFGHVGLDGFEYIRDIWRGDLVGGTVRIRLWRFPAAERPAGGPELVEWVYDRWLELDAWIGEQRADLGLDGGGAAPRARLSA
jgi:1-acyl-sn-glycerol-3-phosphate acyltransferase